MLRTAILIALILAPFAASAQDSDFQLRASIRFLAWHEQDTKLTPSLWSNSSGSHKIEHLHTYDKTEPLKYKGPAELIFTSGTVSPDETNAYKLKINPAWKDVLVLVRANESHPSGLSMTALDNSTTNFPWGSYRVINTTGRALKIKIDKQVFALSDKPIPKTFSVSSEEGMINILAALKESKEPLFGCISPHSKNIRKLIILSPTKDKRLGHLTARIIPERRPSE